MFSLANAFAQKALNMLFFRSRFEGLPQSPGFSLLIACFLVPSIFIEQIARDRTPEIAIIVIAVSLLLGYLFGTARHDNRVTAGLYLVSIPLCILMALSALTAPALEIAVSLWGGILYAWLLQPTSEGEALE